MRTLKGKLVMPEGKFEYGLYNGIEFINLTDILNNIYYNQDNQYIELEISTKYDTNLKMTTPLSGELIKRKNEFGFYDWYLATDKELEIGYDLGSLLFDLVDTYVEVKFSNKDIIQLLPDNMEEE